MWWDDDFEQNVYVGGVGTTLASHVKFTGLLSGFQWVNLGYPLGPQP